MLADVCEYLEQFAPPRLAEDWDNVGLLVGDRSRAIDRVMTCLTITPESVAEAIAERAELIVTHHPLPFRALKSITTETTAGTMLLQLIRADVAVYSPHTSFDSAAAGINEQLAAGIGLVDRQPLQPMLNDPDALGSGRCGRFDSPQTGRQVVEKIKSFLNVSGLHIVGDPDAPLHKGAVACGAAGGFLDTALRQGCDFFLTGETNFHTCLEASARSIFLALPGHYATERFAVERLAESIAAEFPQLSVWASQQEADPLRWV